MPALSSILLRTNAENNDSATPAAIPAHRRRHSPSMNPATAASAANATIYSTTILDPRARSIGELTRGNCDLRPRSKSPAGIFPNCSRKDTGRERGRQVRSIPPEVLEPIRRQRGVDGRAGDRAMPQPSLDRPGVVPFVGEGVPAGVAQHVWVRLDLQAGGGRGPFDQPGEAGRGEGRAALADEDEGRRVALAGGAAAPEARSPGSGGCSACRS